MKYAERRKRMVNNWLKSNMFHKLLVKNCIEEEETKKTQKLKYLLMISRGNISLDNIEKQKNTTERNRWNGMV